MKYKEYEIKTSNDGSRFDIKQQNLKYVHETCTLEELCFLIFKNSERD